MGKAKLVSAIDHLGKISYEQLLSDLAERMANGTGPTAGTANEVTPDPVTYDELEELFEALEESNEDAADEVLEKFEVRKLKKLDEDQYDEAAAMIRALSADAGDAAGGETDRSEITKAELSALYKEAKAEDADEAKAVLAEYDATTVAKLDADDYEAVAVGLDSILSDDNADNEDVVVTPEVLQEVVQEGYDSDEEKAVRKAVKGYGFTTKKATLAQAKKLDEEDMNLCYDEVLELIQPDE